VTTTIEQLTTVRRASRRLKNYWYQLWKQARANTALHLLTQKSELNQMYIATLQACIHNKPRSVW